MTQTNAQRAARGLTRVGGWLNQADLAKLDALCAYADGASRWAVIGALIEAAHNTLTDGPGEARVKDGG